MPSCNSGAELCSELAETVSQWAGRKLLLGWMHVHCVWSVYVRWHIASYTVVFYTENAIILSLGYQLSRLSSWFQTCTYIICMHACAHDRCPTGVFYWCINATLTSVSPMKLCRLVFFSYQFMVDMVLILPTYIRVWLWKLLRQRLWYYCQSSVQLVFGFMLWRSEMLRSLNFM